MVQLVRTSWSSFSALLSMRCFCFSCSGCPFIVWYLSLSLSILSYSIYSKMLTYSYISIFSHITWNFKCELQLLRIWIMETRIWNNMVTFTNFCQSTYKMAVTPLIVLSQTFLKLQLSWHCVSSVKSGPIKRVQVYLSEIQNSVKKFHILIIFSHLDLFFYWTGRSKIFFV